MSVSKLKPLGGANDFNLAITGTNTSTIFTKEYAAGAYSIESGSADSTLDIYAYNDNGDLAGYTSNKSFAPDIPFNKIVVLGGTAGDVLGFSYKTTYVTQADNNEVTAGPFIQSISPLSAPAIDTEVTITGGNFSTDYVITLKGSDNVIRTPKSTSRTSVTELKFVRPDVLPAEHGPYSIIVENLNVPSPTGSSVNILPTALSAGNKPVWSTTSPLPIFTKNSAYSTTLVATDSETTSLSYVITSGTLPDGLTINESTGVISGTPTTATPSTFTVRAMDAGNNYAERTFLLPNVAPVWVSSGTLPSATYGIAYSYQLSATDDNSTVTYSIATGSLPPGLTLSSSGLISGSITSLGTFTFTVNATDSNGTATTSGTFTINALGNTKELVLSTGNGGGWGYGSGTDAITITFSQNVRLSALSIGTFSSGSFATGDISIRVWQGTSTSGTQVGYRSLTGYTPTVVNNVLKLPFNSDVLLTANVAYTVGLVCIGSVGFGTNEGGAKNTSGSFVYNGNTVTYSAQNATFNGGGALSSTNGTSMSNGQMQRLFLVEPY